MSSLKAFVLHSMPHNDLVRYLAVESRKRGCLRCADIRKTVLPELLAQERKTLKLGQEIAAEIARQESVRTQRHEARTINDPMEVADRKPGEGVERSRIKRVLARCWFPEAQDNSYRSDGFSYRFKTRVVYGKPDPKDKYGSCPAWIESIRHDGVRERVATSRYVDLDQVLRQALAKAVMAGSTVSYDKAGFCLVVDDRRVTFARFVARVDKLTVTKIDPDGAVMRRASPAKMTATETPEQEAPEPVLGCPQLPDWIFER